MTRIPWKLFIRDSKMRKNTWVLSMSILLLLAGSFAKTYLSRTYGSSQNYETALLVNGFSVFFWICFSAVVVLTAVTVLLETGYSRQEITLLQYVGYTARQVLSFEVCKYAYQACISFSVSCALFSVVEVLTVNAIPASSAGRSFSGITFALAAAAVIPVTAYICVACILARSDRKV